MVSMPVVLRFGRFRFIIYPMDHRPAHVHIIAQGAEAKFDIDTGACIAVYGFHPKTVKQLSSTVVANKDLLMEAWDEYEGEE